MSDDPSEDIKRRFAEFLAFRKALSEESDRGCALFAAAFLDNALSELLALSLVDDKRITHDLFEGTAPISTFSSRIKLAYYLGKISKECRSDLDTIRGIRNEFAHHATAMSFEDQSIADRCRNFRFSWHEKKDGRPRGHFTAAVTGILAMVNAMSSDLASPAAKLDDSPSEDMKAAVRAKTSVRQEVADAGEDGGE